MGKQEHRVNRDGRRRRTLIGALFSLFSLQTHGFIYVYMASYPSKVHLHIQVPAWHLLWDVPNVLQLGMAPSPQNPVPSSVAVLMSGAAWPHSTSCPHKSISGSSRGGELAGFSHSFWLWLGMARQGILPPPHGSASQGPNLVGAEGTHAHALLDRFTARPG